MCESLEGEQVPYAALGERHRKGRLNHQTSRYMKNRNSAGGKTLAKIEGYHALLSQRSHGKISKSEFKRKAALVLEKAKKPAKKAKRA